LAGEIKFACRLTDVIGRWGGDEFIILLDCGITDAQAQIDRLREWVCGNYQVSGKSGPASLQINASIGVAEHVPAETMNQLLSRADAAMYEVKAVSRKRGPFQGDKRAGGIPWLQAEEARRRGPHIQKNELKNLSTVTTVTRQSSATFLGTI
jgi:GGDEF domain-containing protein